MSDTKKCPFCAEEIKFEAIKCKHCGSSLASSLATPPAKKTNRVLPLLAAFVVFATLGVAAIMFSKPTQQSTSTEVTTSGAPAAVQPEPSASEKLPAKSATSGELPDYPASMDGCNLYFLKQPIDLDGVRYVVDKMEMTKQIGDPKFLGRKANDGAMYIIFDYTVQNNRKETVTVLSDGFHVFSRRDEDFSPDSEANTALSMVRKNKDMFLSQLQPGVKKHSCTAFELPERTLHGQETGFYLKIPSDEMFSGKKAFVAPVTEEAIKHHH
ncbi:MAG TPA: DUF4352 domain-containing protein [Drouetiella sp.]